jgi:hypothetical protein
MLTETLDRRSLLLSLLPAAACSSPASPAEPAEPPVRLHRLSVVNLSAISGDFGTVTAGTVSGAGLTIDLDATGSDPVLSHPGFTLRADGSATFSGVVAASSFTGTAPVFDNSLVVQAGQGDTRVRLSQGSGGGNIQVYSETGALALTLRALDDFVSIDAGTGEALRLSGGAGVRLFNNLGFYGATAISKPTVSGSKAGNAALGSLLTALATLGLVTDSTS